MRPLLRRMVWDEMLRLEQAGLGRREVVSDQRDKFMLRHPATAASQLSSRPEANGFVRADSGSLLLRAASRILIDALPASLVNRRSPSSKGLEFRWTALRDDDIRALFDAILMIAGAAGEGVTGTIGTDENARPDRLSEDSLQSTRLEDPSGTFETAIRELTRPLNGQYPRPWMTSLLYPQRARVFVVGKNQATGFPAQGLSHTDYLDALFNRNGGSCRGLYDEVRRASGKGPSPTRGNLDFLSGLLKAHGVDDVLETNVICYSTPMSSDLRRPIHAGGVQRGTEIFRSLLYLVRPAVLIAHGAGTRTRLSTVLGTALPDVPNRADEGVQRGDLSILRPDESRQQMAVFVIPSLAPPSYNIWSAWAPDHLRDVAAQVARFLEGWSSRAGPAGPLGVKLGTPPHEPSE